MQAEKYLEHAWRLNNRIQLRLRQIVSLREMAESISACLGGPEPVSHSRNVTAQQEIIAQIADEETTVKEEFARLIRQKKALAETIAMIPREEHRRLLEMRYLDFRKWDSIIDELGCSRSWMYLVRRDALAAVQDLLDQGIAQPLPDPDRRMDLSTEPVE